jgi:hypothetical protein
VTLLVSSSYTLAPHPESVYGRGGKVTCFINLGTRRKQVVFFILRFQVRVSDETLDILLRIFVVLLSPYR